MTTKQSLLFLLIALALFLLVACGAETDRPAQSLQTDEAPVARSLVPAATDQPTTRPTTVPAEETNDRPDPTAVALQGETDQELPETDTLIPAATTVTPVEVPYLTPAQQEGPYYPVDKLHDRDNDLVLIAGAESLPAGQILEFGGTVYDAGGFPLEGAVVEIWQTDAAGVYLHPNDPGTANRDRNFQFYGEAQTGPDGAYNFRTILPGLYEPRPRHIHVKVKLAGQELLTTQFYFAGEIDLQGPEALMLIDAQPGVDEAGNPILTGQRDIFLNVNPPAD